jgi:biotin carboxylase
MDRALEATVIEGIRTSTPLQLEIMRDEVFQSGDLSTRFMDGFFERQKAKAAGEK